MEEQEREQVELHPMSEDLPNVMGRDLAMMHGRLRMFHRRHLAYHHWCESEEVADEMIQLSTDLKEVSEARRWVVAFLQQSDVQGYKVRDREKLEQYLEAVSAFASRRFANFLAPVQQPSQKDC